jgi:LuxR family maltose regulon positive regulatory protein
MSDALLSTKLYIPPARAEGVSRPRLTDKLLAGVNRPGSFTLLSGPAGFGKTTLLGEFVGRFQRPVAWVSLDEGDNDPVLFWSYVIAACQMVHAGLCSSAQVMLQSPQPLPAETIPTILVNDIAGLDQELVLVLDDYHVIQDVTIHSAFSYLLEHLPGKLHVLISTRVDPPWPLARFRARNQLVEIRAQDLRFTTDEAAAFLNQVMGVHLKSEDIAALEERTEGWIAGLQLAALSMQGRSDPASFIRAFTGSHSYVAEYLIEEILQRQSEVVQAFLLQTSLLERMNPDLCEAVTGFENGQSMLMALHRANLFVISLDDEGWWFRYHQLFADLLRARLRHEWSVDAIAILHRRAADWYDQAGMTQEAIEHALAIADYSRALELIEKIILPMVLKAYFKRVEDWVQAISPEYLNENLRVNMALARMHLMRRNLTQAAPHLERLQRIFSTLSRNAADKEYGIGPSLLGEWLALQAMLMNAQGKAIESIDLAEEALKNLPEDETQVRSITYMGLAAAYEQTQDYERAAEACEQIIQQGRAAGDLPSELFGLSYLSLMVLQQGKLRSAYETASEALQRIQRTGSFFPFSATLYGELAQVYYHWHQLEKAREHFSRSVELSIIGGFSDAEIYHHVFLSRLFQMEGDLQASMDEMERALDRMQGAAPALVKEEVTAQQVSILLALDRPTAAQNALKTYGFSFEEGFNSPEITEGAAIPHAVGLLYISALRILLIKGVARHKPDALRDGVQLAGLVIEGASRCRHLPIVLKTHLLRSQMQTMLGDEQAGIADVARALELGEPEGFISIFVEEGAPIAEALKNLLKRNLAGRALAGYIQDILTAFPKTQSQEEYPPHKPARSDELATDQSVALFEPLTTRELEVLRLIAAGDSNRAIAEKLVITVSAVKKHTGNIYGKLNVNSRTQAVARARQLGLLRKDG